MINWKSYNEQSGAIAGVVTPPRPSGTPPLIRRGILHSYFSVFLLLRVPFENQGLRNYLSALLFFCSSAFLPLSAQQVQLKGVVTVQNSKTYTGKTQFVKNAEVEHVNLNNAKTKDVTGDDGKFTLNIKGAIANTQTQINVTTYGEFADYVVVNENELKDITLGRLTPVSVFVCKKGELEKRQAEMVGINMRKLEEKMEADKKRLQKELDAIRANNDYLNVRYSEIKDSLDILSKNIDHAFERIKEYAKTMTLENLDDRDENYVKAYNCFSRGALDSVSYYLQEQELELKYQKILQVWQETQKKKDLVETLTESIKKEEEFTEKNMNELLKEWLLLARTAGIQNDYEKAEKYYKNCLKMNREFAVENPKIYLPHVATALHNLAILHKDINDYSTALQEFEEALLIRRALALENQKTYSSVLANTLNDFANFFNHFDKYFEALQNYEEALQIRRNLALENPKENLPFVAQTLNNLAVLYTNHKKYSDALPKYEEALKIHKEFAEENHILFLPVMAQILNNLAIVSTHLNEISNALEKYEDALEIRRKLAFENPKVYLPDVAQTLHNLGILYLNHQEYSDALQKFEEALEIRKTFAVEAPKKYLPEVANSLNCLGVLYFSTNRFFDAKEIIHESLKIYEELSVENPDIYLENIVSANSDISLLYLYLKEYKQAAQYAYNALKIDNYDYNAKKNLAFSFLFQHRLLEAEALFIELTQTFPDGNENPKQDILEDFILFKDAGIILEEYKTEVERIIKMLQDN